VSGRGEGTNEKQENNGRDHVRMYIGRQHKIARAKRRKGKEKNHDIGAAIIDLRFDAADNDPDVAAVARGEGRIVFSFSSDAELVERSTSDDDDASFAWRSSSVPDIDDGRRSGAALVVVAATGGDLVAERPPNAEEMDGTRT
jgi:hypothetical protein